MSKKLILIGLVGILALVLVFAQCGRDKNNPVSPIQTTTKIQVDEVDPLAPHVHLSATITATVQLARTWAWTIASAVTPASWDLFKGDAGKSEYTVTVTKASHADIVSSISGAITVTNTDVFTFTTHIIRVDVLYKVGDSQFQVLKSMQVSTAAKPVLGVGEAYSYPYETDITPVEGAIYKNQARITFPYGAQEIYGGIVYAEFQVPTEEPTLERYGSINITDSNGESWTNISATSELKYTKTFSAAGTHQNTATITETQQSASAEVTVNVHELTVTTDAIASYDRNWNWTINGSADQNSLLLAVGESFPVNYSVTVAATATDANMAINGNITVHNPAPIAATIKSVADVVSPEIAANIDFGSANFPYSLAAGGDLAGTYSTELTDLTSRTNTATATLQNYGYDKDLNKTASGTTDFATNAEVAFKGPTNEYDEYATLSDTYQSSTVTGTVYAADMPKTFTDNRIIGPFEACGDYTVDNTASFISNDTQTSDSKNWPVAVTIPCGGCTRPLAYWKKTTIWGPGTYDENWDKKDKGNAEFLDTGYSYYQMLEMAPKGGNIYIKLAQRYIAAELNKLNNAYMSLEVFTAFSQARALLVSYQYTMDISKKSDDRDLAISLMTVFDNYNNGLMGTPPCQ